MKMPKRNVHQDDALERTDDLSDAEQAATEGEPVPADGAVIQEIEVPEDAAALIQELQSELDKAITARKRALADFANYQRRVAGNEYSATQSGAARVVRSLLGVLDHFDLALDQDTEQITVPQLLGGVRIARDELIKALDSHGVERIEPATGEEFDPNRHEAVMHQSADGIKPNQIVSVLQPGYTMGDLVLRPAKVTIAAPQEGE